MREYVALLVMTSFALAACGRDAAETSADPARGTAAEAGASSSSPERADDAPAVADVCAAIDHAAALAALGFAGGKIEPATIAGGSACAAVDASGGKSVVITLSGSLEMGAPETEASSAISRLMDSLTDPDSLKAHPPGAHTIALMVGPAKFDVPVVIAGWLDGSSDGHMGLVAGDRHLLVSARGVDQARVLALVRGVGPKLLAAN